MLERFSKSYRIINKEKFVEKLINFSVDQDHFILLNSNNNSDKYDLLCAYGVKSFIKSSENSLKKLDNFFELKKELNFLIIIFFLSVWSIKILFVLRKE